MTRRAIVSTVALALGVALFAAPALATADPGVTNIKTYALAGGGADTFAGGASITLNKISNVIAAYVAGTSKYVQDIHPEDVYWCMADIGWITGHSYIVYGPLALCASTVIYEGIPNYPDPGRPWRIAQELGRERSALAQIVETLDELNAGLADCRDLLDMAVEEDDGPGEQQDGPDPREGDGEAAVDRGRVDADALRAGGRERGARAQAGNEERVLRHEASHPTRSRTERSVRAVRGGADHPS